MPARKSGPRSCPAPDLGRARPRRERRVDAIDIEVLVPGVGMRIEVDQADRSVLPGDRISGHLNTGFWGRIRCSVAHRRPLTGCFSSFSIGGHRRPEPDFAVAAAVGAGKDPQPLQPAALRPTRCPSARGTGQRAIRSGMPGSCLRPMPEGPQLNAIAFQASQGTAQGQHFQVIRQPPEGFRGPVSVVTSRAMHRIRQLLQ